MTTHSFHPASSTPSRRRRLRRHVGWRVYGAMRRLVRHRRGATMLETVLLLAAIAIPSYVIIRLALQALVGYYHMMVTLIDLPFP